MYYDISTKLLKSCTDRSLLPQHVTCVICHWQWETMWVTVLVVNQNVIVIDNLIIKLVTWIILLVDSACIMTTPEHPLSCCTLNTLPLFSCSSWLHVQGWRVQRKCAYRLVNEQQKWTPTTCWCLWIARSDAEDCKEQWLLPVRR